jgi:hypothetical protein
VIRKKGDLTNDTATVYSSYGGAASSACHVIAMLTDLKKVNMRVNQLLIVLRNFEPQ